MARKEVRDLIRKYSAELEMEISNQGDVNYSQEYQKFREESLANLSGYERACQSIGGAFTLKLSPKDEEKLSKQISGARLDITPGQAAGFGVFVLLLSFFVSVLLSVGIYLLTNEFPILLLLMLVFVSIFIYYYVSGLPARMEQKWRLKASSQMVPAILYLVVYMRHTSNLERAVRFASEYLPPPLSLDFKKIFWNVQTGKFTTIKDSLDSYLETWRTHSLEFVEAFHMVESSLYETSEERRIAILEKSLEIILDGVYEKTLHYTHDVKSPITNVYMLGIVLPTLGLALLPLASTLLQGAIKWYHVALLFNIFIPFLVFYLTNDILSKRPGGFGETELLERNPNYKYYADNSIYFVCTLIALPILLLGLLPFILHYSSQYFGLQPDYSLFTFKDLGITLFGDSFANQKIFGFEQSETGGYTGPFGVFALLLSLFIPLAIMLFFTIAYDYKTKRLIETRKETKRLEGEFAGSIFQLGNRLADGIPTEMAFGRIATALHDTPTAGFFSVVNLNIQQAGMSVENAIFDKNRGAINQYPSSLVKTSMKILIESSKKGLQVAAKALMSISSYVKNIHRVDERLKDLLADVTSEMKSNMTFLAPLLAAIVVGLSSMITSILIKLQDLLSSGQLAGAETTGFNLQQVLSLFQVSTMIPPYWMQVIVGVYLVQIIFILTKTLVTIESGEDLLGEKAEISKMLKRGITLYIFVALISIIALAALANIAVAGISI